MPGDKKSKSGLEPITDIRFNPVQQVRKKPHQLFNWRGAQDWEELNPEDDPSRPINAFSPVVRLFVVDSATGDRLPFSTTLVSKARDVKERIAGVMSIPVSQAKISWRGQVLLDSRTLISYKIEPGECIHVMRRPCDPSLGNTRPTHSHFLPSIGRSLVDGSSDSFFPPTPNSPQTAVDGDGLGMGSVTPRLFEGDGFGVSSTMKSLQTDPTDHSMLYPSQSSPRNIAQSKSPPEPSTARLVGSESVPRGLLTLSVCAIDDSLRPRLARMEVRVYEADNVFEVKRQLEVMSGIKVGDQRITFGGQTLSNEHTLGSYGIHEDGLKLQLVVPFGKSDISATALERNALLASKGSSSIDTGKFTVSVREVWSGGRRHRVALTADNTIRIIKEQIAVTNGISADKLILFHRGRVLDDELTADFYNLEGGDFIDLTVVGGVGPKPCAPKRRPMRMKPSDDYPYCSPAPKPQAPQKGVSESGFHASASFESLPDTDLMEAAHALLAGMPGSLPTPAGGIDPQSEDSALPNFKTLSAEGFSALAEAGMDQVTRSVSEENLTAGEQQASADIDDSFDSALASQVQHAASADIDDSFDSGQGTPIARRTSMKHLADQGSKKQTFENPTIDEESCVPDAEDSFASAVAGGKEEHAQSILENSEAPDAGNLSEPQIDSKEHVDNDPVNGFDANMCMPKESQETTVRDGDSKAGENEADQLLVSNVTGSRDVQTQNDMKGSENSHITNTSTSHTAPRGNVENPVEGAAGVNICVSQVEESATVGDTSNQEQQIQHVADSLASGVARSKEEQTVDVVEGLERGVAVSTNLAQVAPQGNTVEADGNLLLPEI